MEKEQRKAINKRVVALFWAYHQGEIGLGEYFVRIKKQRDEADLVA